MRLRSQTPDFYSDACTEGTLHERLIAIVSKGMKHYRDGGAVFGFVLWIAKETSLGMGVSNQSLSILLFD